MPRFFGEFLIASGEIDHDPLQQALEQCDQVNLRLGQLAIRESFLDRQQVEEVLKKHGRSIGALAKLRLLSILLPSRNSRHWCINALRATSISAKPWYSSNS